MGARLHDDLGRFLLETLPTRNLAGCYDDPDLMPSLAVQQNDEKDLYITRGIKGLPDLGDGECQSVTVEHDEAVDTTAKLEAEMRALPAESTVDGTDYRTVHHVLSSGGVLLCRYRDQALELIKGTASNIKKLDKKARKRETTQKEREAIAKKTAFLNSQVGEVDSLNRRVSALVNDLVALPAVGTSPPTASRAAGLAKDVKEMIMEAFGFAYRYASKTLAVMSCSVFDCSSKALSSLAFTPDNLATWELKEIIMKNAIDMYTKGQITVIVGADKAFAAAADSDQDGFAKNVTTAKKEVEELTALIPPKAGYVAVSVKKWRRTRDLRDAAEELLRNPHATANGAKREAWMDDAVQCTSIQRWRRFLLKWNVVQISVYLAGYDTLGMAHSIHHCLTPPHT